MTTDASSVSFEIRKQTDRTTRGQELAGDIGLLGAVHHRLLRRTPFDPDEIFEAFEQLAAMSGESPGDLSVERYLEMAAAKGPTGNEARTLLKGVADHLVTQKWENTRVRAMRPGDRLPDEPARARGTITEIRGATNASVHLAGVDYNFELPRLGVALRLGESVEAEQGSRAVSQVERADTMKLSCVLGRTATRGKPPLQPVTFHVLR